jgi:cytochrome P450 / NADPH-cytochrome P450 reductase
MQLVLASVFQKFDLSLVDPSYNLELRQTLTIKPKNLYIRARLRDARPRFYALPSVKRVQALNNDIVINPTVGAKQSLYVFYGSNTGTSETFAQRIATAAPSYGNSNQFVPVKYFLTFVCFLSRFPVHDGDS